MADQDSDKMHLHDYHHTLMLSYVLKLTLHGGEFVSVLVYLAIVAQFDSTHRRQDAVM